jgi:hypothetical protein
VRVSTSAETALPFTVMDTVGMHYPPCEPEPIRPAPSASDGHDRPNPSRWARGTARQTLTNSFGVSMTQVKNERVVAGFDTVTVRVPGA